MTHAHDILTQGSWISAPINTVVEGTLAPHRTGEGRIRTNGPAVNLTSKQALSLALALHELATNAAKYGALSTANGTIDLTWTCITSVADPILRFDWRETGGPTVSKPLRRGFGTRLIESTLSADFGDSAKIVFPSTGVVCSFESKLSDLAEQDGISYG